jgi:hypothetical protein
MPEENARDFNGSGFEELFQEDCELGKLSVSGSPSFSLSKSILLLLV